jgi:hypothetical protein
MCLKFLTVVTKFMSYDYSKNNFNYCIKVLSPTDTQGNRFKRSIKIYIKTVATCFGVVTIIRERTI